MKARSLVVATVLAAATSLGFTLTVTSAQAQAAHEPPAPRRPADPNAPPPRPADPRANPPRAADPHAPPSRLAPPTGGQPGHIAVPGGAARGAQGHPAAANTAHGAPGHAESGHGEHAEHDEKAPPPPINWWHGLLGEKANEPPSLLWRAPGDPPPFLASLINFGILVLIVNRYGRKALSDALVKRKEGITREIDEATRMRKAAEERLQQYEAKLAKISDELERVRREFREQGEREKERIIQEAKERRERMRSDTEIVLGQEAKQMRQELLSEVVAHATRVASEILSKNTTLGDHDRFAESFLNQLRSSARLSVTPPARGGGSSYPGPAAAKGSAS
jgi:F-type H+-transporting ATPase subunit b